MAADRSRYLEGVEIAGADCQSLADVWCGAEDEHDGLSQRRERLELRADGSFTHTLARRVPIPGDAVPVDRQRRGEEAPCEVSCAGKWRLYNVRHLGADVDALGSGSMYIAKVSADILTHQPDQETDREIRFELGAGNRPPLVERLVCGVNPHVNGFLGAECRLYPESLWRDAPCQAAAGGARTGRRLDEEEEDDAVDAADAADADDADDGPEELPSEDQARALAEATGCCVDECWAALYQHRGRAEEAAEQLLARQEAAEAAAEASEVAAGDEAGAVGPGGAEEVSATDAQQLAEATGCPLGKCSAALGVHGGRVDDAAMYLLSLASAGRQPTQEGPDLEVPAQEAAAQDGPAAAPAAAPAEVSGSGPGLGAEAPTVPAPPPAAAAVTAAAAVPLAEATGQPLQRCLQVLRECEGRADEAAARLLGLTVETSADEAAGEDAEGDVVGDAAMDAAASPPGADEDEDEDEGEDEDAGTPPQADSDDHGGPPAAKRPRSARAGGDGPCASGGG